MDNLADFCFSFLHFVGKHYNAGVRIFWLFLLTAALLAAIAYLRDCQDRPSVKGFCSFLFPKSVWLSKSAMVDYLFFILVVPVWSAIIAPSLLSSATVGATIAESMGSIISPLNNASDPVVVGLMYTIVLFLADDFRRYIVHYSFHRFQFLWEFHKVHHSAEVLTPFTLYREHPVYSFVAVVSGAMLIGIVTGVFVGLYGDTLSVVSVLGINVGYFVFNICGSNLRHSHVWLSWGPRIEKFFISPAQHQIHHSAQEKHFDRNFGSALAVWDRIFGTLYIPVGKEMLTYGLPEENEDWLKSPVSLLVEPFRKVHDRWMPKKATREGNT